VQSGNFDLGGMLAATEALRLTYLDNQNALVEMSSALHETDAGVHRPRTTISAASAMLARATAPTTSPERLGEFHEHQLYDLK